MIFTSLIFFAGFLPVSVLAYYRLPRRCRNWVLLASSLTFYAWGNLRYLGIILALALADYLLGLALEALPDKRGGIRRALLALGVAFSVGILIYFKYFDFLADNCSALLGIEYTLKHIVMPLGISFFVFQSVAYLMDVYRRTEKAQTDLLGLTLFFVFFPKVMQGPIVKYGDFARDLSARRESLELFTYGLRRFLSGFAKKVLIADTLGLIADSVFSAPVNTLGVGTAWGGALAYTLQIYFDFSGYSDMAVGLGALFGFDIMENFNYPYLSTSVTEFWRRWHISLGAWFRDYLYIPLGGNRVSKRRNLLNLTVVFLVTGLWHGAAWTFVFWGAFHGFFILLERLTGWHKKLETRALRMAHHAYLMLVIVVGWVFFRADSFGYAAHYVRRMFGLTDGFPVHTFGFYFSPFGLLVMSLGIVLSTGCLSSLILNRSHRLAAQIAIDLSLVAMFVVSIAFLASSSYCPFIYFKF